MEGATSTTLFYGFTGSSDYLNSSLKDIPSEEPKHLSVRSHRKSRKHQRFMRRKAFLQQRGLLCTRILEPVEEDVCFVLNKDHSCNLQYADQTAKDTDDHSLKDGLHVLTAVAPSLHCTSCDDDSGLSVSGSSPSSRHPSPVPWLKPGNCVAIDCEMVGTGPASRISELARCSIVNYMRDVVYDKYIKPELPVTDYRTRWSGITAHHMKNAISFKIAQKEILKILKGKRLIGHALHNDFKVLKYYHPKGQTIDTSKTPLLNQMAELPKRSSPSLKTLAWCLLHKTIQVGRKGHSSVEDAQTCMELYKLVEDRLEQDSLSSHVDDSLSNSHYMDDQYWPSDLEEDCK